MKTFISILLFTLLLSCSKKDKTVIKTPEVKTSVPEGEKSSIEEESEPESSIQTEEIETIDNEEDESKTVQALTQGICSTSKQEINCYKEIVSKKDILTLSDDRDECTQGVLRGIDRLSEKITRKLYSLSKSEKSDINKKLSSWKEVIKNFHNNQQTCVMQSLSPDSLFNCYNRITDDYLRVVQEKFCKPSLSASSSFI